ncbi:DUF4389 domain-containing protein [Thalassococcus lentus]|uniref:DUF4389 domain-containing protein n=1 Tax=Thalassococcus lentus TaxID=1210524 RepID=A0ABT4XW01_9RHOB|nr:DUF4389 domain-containing protein [Thalassococcus lentus]MDA7426150.1 DUF4389 domain-containing protein [Thalassococcus lentus]
MMGDEEKVDGRLNGEQPTVERDGLPVRLLYVVIIWVMLSLAQTVLGVATIVQFVLMALNQGKPNERLADFGTDLGIWMAKAARYQTGASDVKPWPWTELD